MFHRQTEQNLSTPPDVTLYDVTMRALVVVILTLSVPLCTRAATRSLRTFREPLLVKYCYDCHADGGDSGKFEMDAYHTDADMTRGEAQWSKTIKYIRAHTMPPPKDPQPSEDERDAMVHSIASAVYTIDPAHPDPGHVVIRRLNAAEYRNTMRDLLEISFDPTVDFPPDDTGYGFDNIGDVLSLPPMLLEKYFTAAEKVLNVAFGDELAEPPRTRSATGAGKQAGNVADNPGDAGEIRRIRRARRAPVTGATRRRARAFLNDFTNTRLAASGA